MISIPKLGRRLAQSLGIAAAAVLMMSAAQRAEALSPLGPAAAPIAKAASGAPITEVHGHGGGGMHFGGGGSHGGGGAHFGGGGMHGGAMHLGGGGMHGGGMHAVPGGGFHHHGGHFIFAHRHHRHFGHGFYGYGYDDYPASYYYPRRCPLVWTHYGPRRICHYHRWHHRWHRHHHHRHHYRY